MASSKSAPFPEIKAWRLPMAGWIHGRIQPVDRNQDVDLVMAGGVVLQTKRRVIGQITVCSGCRCGAVHRGKPDVPVEWLKFEWRSRGLLKVLQLTIAACMGPCGLNNVVRIPGPQEDV